MELPQKEQNNLWRCQNDSTALWTELAVPSFPWNDTADNRVLSSNVISTNHLCPVTNIELIYGQEYFNLSFEIFKNEANMTKAPFDIVMREEHLINVEEDAYFNYSLKSYAEGGAVGIHHG